MKGRFVHRNIVTRVVRAELARLSTPIAVNERACCCPAKPMVTVVMPPTARRPYPVDLLLCGHHYRVSQAALRTAGAAVYDETGVPVTAGTSDYQYSPPPASRGSAASVADKSFIPNGLVVPAPEGHDCRG